MLKPGRDATSDPTPYAVANVHVTRRLCEAAARLKVRRIVFASTVKVYGESTLEGRPFRAGDPAAPRDAYARSKAEAERVLWEVCAGTALEGVVLRLPLTYGAGVKGNFLALIEAIAARRRLPLAGIDNRRSVLNVDNAVSAMVAALAVPAVAGQTLPVADSQSVSTSELAERLGVGDVPAVHLGYSGGASLTVEGLLSLPLAELRQAHEEWLPAYMNAAE